MERERFLFVEEKKTEKDKEEKFWRRKICFFLEERKNGEGKGGIIWGRKLMVTPTNRPTERVNTE